MSHVIAVLVYHAVRDAPPPDFDRWTVTPAALAAHLDAIAASGRTALTIDELARGLRGTAPLPERAVALTFDDGFADNAEALALVAERGLCATLYVTTGQLGAPEMLTPAALRDVATLPGVQIGAHGVHHHRLDELRRDEVDAEIRGSRDALEDLLGRPVTSFAYPHGAHDRGVRAPAVAAGLHSAAAVKNAFSHPQDDPFAIGRWIVEAGTPPARVAEVLAGDGLPRAWARERVKTRGYRAVRRLRRRAAVLRGKAELVARP